MGSISNSFKTFKRIAKNPKYRARYRCAEFHASDQPLNERHVLFQSFDGKSFGGNPFYLLLEMCRNPRYHAYRKIVAVNEGVIPSVQKMLETYRLSDVEVVAINTKRYCEALMTSKYLVNNSTFPSFFIKREGQVYLNTWHGTPLKHMGRKMANHPQVIGNTQRNLLMADYLLYPNRFSLDCFREDYMLGPFYSGTYLLGGYPCNEAFFNDERKAQVKEELGVANKKIVVYMPTFRESLGKGYAFPHEHMLKYSLAVMDNQIDSDTVIFAKPHYYSRGLSYKGYRHTRPFPAGYETYDILSIADVLITDYSSVMFDFLNAGKPTVLYAYDEKEYFSTRGTYQEFSSLPFPVFHDAYDMCEFVNRAIGTSASYPEAQRTYCEYDSETASADLCRLLIDGEGSPSITQIAGDTFHNGKPNVLIFAGGLKKNGITTALEGLLSQLDAKDANYIITFYASRVSGCEDFINRIGDDLYYLPIQGAQAMRFPEIAARSAYYSLGMSNASIEKHLQSLYRRELERIYPTLSFKAVINFSGYERHIMHLFAEAKDAKRIIYVHNDVVQEHLTKNNIHLPSHQFAYHSHDAIVLVRDSLRKPLREEFGIPDSKLHTVHNPLAISSILEKSNEAVVFDNQTVATCTVQELNSLLNDKSITKFINIARFSQEKGQDQLIEGFMRYRSKNPLSALIVIGGYGNEYRRIRELASAGIDDKSIVVIRSISNPYPILSKCDTFILSSHFEGLPMTIMEALILGVPVVSTDIEGPREFLSQGYGYLVPDSVEGIVEGFQAKGQGKLDELTRFDASAFNDQALKEFHDLVFS